MKGMLHLWQQVILIQHTDGRSKLLILIKQDWQESNCFLMTWQLSLILQVTHTYIISLAGYGMKNVIMGVGTFIHRVHQVSQKKCCANGALSSVSCNFDEGLMMRFALYEMPLFMRMVTTSCKFCQDCTKYNDLLAMAATKVCKYCDNPGFANPGPGVHCVMLSG